MMRFAEWSQTENSLMLTTAKGEWHFQMPDDWKLKNTHPDLFRLAEYVMLYPWHSNEIERETWRPSRRPGAHPGLSFSTGVDSTAAMLLMPNDTQLVYYRRDFASRLRHDNADRLIKKISDGITTTVWQVKSDSEKIREVYAGKMNGFSTDYHCGVGLILLADYLDIGAFGTGMILESAYLYSGYKYRDFKKTPYWKRLAPMFEACGLPIYQPVAGCSEIITEYIVNENGLGKYAISCLRGEDGRICGQCYKCYRKMMRSTSHPVLMSKGVRNILDKTPLKMASSMIYEAQRAVAAGKAIPEQLKPYLPLNVDWLCGHYPPALDLIPDKYRDIAAVNLAKYCQPMPEPYAMHDWNVESGC